MKNVLIIGANGQIAQIVIKRLLDETEDVHLTLYLRNSKRLNNLANNRKVTIIEGDIFDKGKLIEATKNQTIVYVAMVDHDSNNIPTKNVVEAMKVNSVNRIIESSLLGIYDEVPGEFGRWNKEVVGKKGMLASLNADKILESSGLNYTTLRFPWLNDKKEINYQLTYKNQEYIGVSGSRESMADVIVKIIENPTYLSNESVGIADLGTQGEERPVY